MLVGGSTLLYIDQSRAGSAMMQLSTAMSQVRSMNGGQTGSIDMATGSAQAQLTSALARVGADKAMLNAVVLFSKLLSNILVDFVVERDSLVCLLHIFTVEKVTAEAIQPVVGENGEVI